MGHAHTNVVVERVLLCCRHLQEGLGGVGIQGVSHIELAGNLVKECSLLLLLSENTPHPGTETALTLPHGNMYETLMA